MTAAARDRADGANGDAHGGVARAAGVVLAGGASRRMGTPKAALRHDGATFLAHAIAALQHGGIDDLYVVAGHAADAVRAALPAEPAVELLHNPAPERGQLSSLKVALAAVRASAKPVDAVVVTLVDHPAVRAATVSALLDAWRAMPGAAIVVPEHGGRRGHPVLFARGVWDELASTDDTLGARAVVRAVPTRVHVVAVDDPGILIDVDTPDDLRRLRDSTLA